MSCCVANDWEGLSSVRIRSLCIGLRARRTKVRKRRTRGAREGGIPSKTEGATARRHGAKVVLGAASCETAAPLGAPSGVFAMGAALSSTGACAHPVRTPHPTGMKGAWQPAGQQAVLAVSELLAGGRSAPGRCSPSPETMLARHSRRRRSCSANRRL